MNRTIGRNSAVRSDINVTPLVDVVLVLLVIFVVVVPVMTGGYGVALPQASRSDRPAGPAAVVTVTIGAGNRLEVDGVEAAGIADLAGKVRERLDAVRARTIVVSCEPSVRYADAVRALDAVKRGADGGQRARIGLALPPRQGATEASYRER